MPRVDNSIVVIFTRDVVTIDSSRNTDNEQPSVVVVLKSASHTVVGEGCACPTLCIVATRSASCSTQSPKSSSMSAHSTFLRPARVAIVPRAVVPRPHSSYLVISFSAVIILGALVPPPRFGPSVLLSPASLSSHCLISDNASSYPCFSASAFASASSAHTLIPSC